MGQYQLRGRRRRVASSTATCTKCEQTFPSTAEYFRQYADRCYPHSWCRNCENEYGKAYSKSERGRTRWKNWRTTEKGKASVDNSQQIQNEKRKRQRKTDPDRFASYDLKKRIGITLEEKNAKFELQGRKCAICKSEVPNTKKKWFADHCHKTKKFRGVLCGHCNSILGYADDSVAVLFQAILYLVENS